MFPNKATHAATERRTKRRSFPGKWSVANERLVRPMALEVERQLSIIREHRAYLTCCSNDLAPKPYLSTASWACIALFVF